MRLCIYSQLYGMCRLISIQRVCDSACLRHGFVFSWCMTDAIVWSRHMLLRALHIAECTETALLMRFDVGPRLVGLYYLYMLVSLHPMWCRQHTVVTSWVWTGRR